jgi:2-haloalkanoic acid dehalogenase type II
MGQLKAVFLDALGTLVDLEPPWTRLAEQLDAEIPQETLVRAVRAEMAYYKEHSHEGRDEVSLADLRGRCAEVLSDGLGIDVSVDQLVDSIRFHPYPDAIAALEDLRGRGLRLVIVSNWDCSLGRVLELSGLDGRFDAVVSSAEARARKPDPAIFTVALEAAGCSAAEALHVGDTAEEDIAGAQAAGIRALLLDRDGNGDIESLSQIAEHL